MVSQAHNRVSRAYERNDYRNNNVHSHEGCNCAHNDYHEQRGMETAFIAQGISNTVIGQLLAFGGKLANSRQVSLETPEVQQPQNAPVAEEPTQITPEKRNAIITNLKGIFGEDKFNALSSNIQDDLITKYETIKTYHQENNIELSDVELNRRIKTYLTAIEANEKLKQMNEHIINNGFGVPCDITIVDEDIKRERENKQPNEVTDSYLQAILNRGTGKVQLYDKNGDNVLTLQEFIDGNATSKEEAKYAKEFFKVIDKDNNNKISEVEFASHEFAIATLGDEEVNTNEELTFTEWLRQNEILDGGGWTNSYNRASDMVYSALKNRKPQEN